MLRPYSIEHKGEFCVCLLERDTHIATATIKYTYTTYLQLTAVATRVCTNENNGKKSSDTLLSFIIIVSVSMFPDGR